jgi:hypothetical protein
VGYQSKRLKALPQRLFLRLYSASAGRSRADLSARIALSFQYRLPYLFIIFKKLETYLIFRIVSARIPIAIKINSLLTITPSTQALNALFGEIGGRGFSCGQK